MCLRMVLASPDIEALEIQDLSSESMKLLLYFQLLESNKLDYMSNLWLASILILEHSALASILAFETHMSKMCRMIG